jgi:hypothetical protein
MTLNSRVTDNAPRSSRLRQNVMFGKFTREEYPSDSARIARNQTPTFNKQQRSTSNIIIFN